MNALFLFAPAFREFGAQVGRHLAENSANCLIHGIYAGPKEDENLLSSTLGNFIGNLWHLETEEKCWLEKELKSEVLQQIDAEFGWGAAGRILTADRRVGRGFVRGGLCRPAVIGDLANAPGTDNIKKYLAGLHQFLNQVLDQTNPELVFCYAVAAAPAVALYEICRSRNIPFCTLAPSRLGNRFVIDEGQPGKLNCIARRYRAIANSSEVMLEQEHLAAKQLLEDFRARPKPPGYVRFSHQRFTGVNLAKVFLAAIIKTPLYLVQFPKDREIYHEKLARAWFEAWVSWRRIVLDRQYFAAHPPADPFVYFPLQVDPEASTMVLSPGHTDQLSVIEAIAKSMPAHMSLVVKEHIPMLGRRPPGFYRSIAQMPRVTLVAPEHPGIDLVLQSALVAVITGTAAWEAIRLQKPTLIIGDSPFRAIEEGFVYEPCLTHLAKAIPQALELPPAKDQTLINYLAAALAESFELSTSLIWGNFNNHSTEERQQAVRDIVDALQTRMAEARCH